MSFRFTATKLAGTGKQGIIKPDANGYYTQVVGGLNTLNSAGQYYVYEQAKALFDSSSLFQRRIKAGCLYAELGHPKPLPGMSNEEYLQRIMTIEETNTVAHFSEVWLDENFGRDNPQFKNPSLVAIMAKVKPAGPKASALQGAYENPCQEVCFSIRALTRDYYEKGRTNRVLTNIISYDLVHESGIAMARKWDSPACESLIEIPVTERQLVGAGKALPESLATENSRAMFQDCIKSVQDVSGSRKPSILTKW